MPDQNKPVKKSSIFNRWHLIIIIAAFIGIILTGYFIFFTPNYYEGTEPKVFDVARGESFSSVANRIYDEGIIPNKTNFKIAAFIYGAEKKVRAARYKINNGLSYLDLLDLFVEGEADLIREITIKNGQTIKWLGFKVKRDLSVDSAAFVNKAKDENFVHSLGLKQPTMQGYLFPETYYIYENSSPEEVIEIFYGGFKNFFVDSLKRQARKLGFTVHEIVTLASIIKGETNKSSEMPTISAVYHNRLNIGMKLQADPTVQYLLEGGWRRLLHRDLLIDSPYNTYRYAGLPPGPINNPGEDAILAALYPEENDYYYFVADGTGGHKFGRNYNEHLKNVREYRKWLKSQKSKK